MDQLDIKIEQREVVYYDVGQKDWGQKYNLAFNYGYASLSWLPHKSCIYLERHMCMSSGINTMHLSSYNM